MDRLVAAPFVLILTAFIATICPMDSMANGPILGVEIDAGPKPGNPQDQIVIEARKKALRELTQELAKSEDAFFDAYNRINTIREFDVHCQVTTPTGTLLSRRVCIPRFAQDAKENEAKSMLEALTDSTGGLAQVPHGMTASEVINVKYRDYKRHLAEVAAKCETLRKMLGEYEALKKRYDAALKE